MTTENTSACPAGVSDCSILEFDRHHSDRKGNLTVAGNSDPLPFDIKRVYYIYDVPAGENRGGHAHHTLMQLIVAVAGSFTVNIDDGTHRCSFTLNRPYHGLLIKPGIWRTLDNFASGSVALVLASEHYDEADYIRSYDEFLQYRKSIENA